MDKKNDLPDTASHQPRAIAHLEFKAIILLILMLALVGGSIAYVMYARGVFERTQQLTLVADDSEGVIVGMDLTFAGFPVGRVRKIALGDDGKVHIMIDLAKKDAKWVRSTSVFTMEHGLVGGIRLRAFTGELDAPPLPDGAVRTVLRGDVSAEIPQLVTTVHTLVSNLEQMTKADSSLNAALANVQAVTGKLNGHYGVMGVALGSDERAQKIIQALDGVNLLLKKADTQVFGTRGVMVDTQATVVQLNGLLADARASLKKVDAVLVEAQAVGANAHSATADLGALREQVEISLRKVESLVNEINRKWPLARDTELKLP
jgi:phospholipid/cholesterol/gamma-HCH transport system substrate-binding protein